MTYGAGSSSTPVPAAEPQPNLPGGLSPLFAAGINSTSALLVIIGTLIAQLKGPEAEVTTSLFGPAETLLSSDPRTFWIGWAIVVALAGFLVWQWLPAGRESERLQRLAWPALVAGPAHLLWVVLGRAGLVEPTVFLLAVEVGALCWLVWRLVKHEAEHWYAALATDTGWGLTLGFVSVQLLASVGVVAEEFGFATDERLYLIIAIAAYSVFITGALGLAGRLYRQYAVGVALLWGFAWMGWDRLVGEQRNYILGGLAILGCFILFAAFYASARRRRKNIPSLARDWE